MGYMKFSLLFLLSISVAHGQSRFSPKSCLDSSYRMKMNQKGLLFGLLTRTFIIDKKDCIVHITHKKYLPKEWIIDVCREPVHIKVTSATGIDVAKKDGECIKKDKSRDTGDFCAQYFDVLDVIQDEGLIFAQGDRDNLQSDHGKTYCAYLLLRKYLNDSVTFSRYTEVPDIFLDHPAAGAEKLSAPATEVIPSDSTEEKKP